MNWEQYVKEIQEASAFFSIFLNFILILLIAKKSPEQLGSYRYLMIYTALFEMFYSLVHVFVSPIIFSHGTMFLIMTSIKSSIFSKDILLLSLCLWCGCFGSFMLLFCIQFIYRYFVVIGSRAIKSFKDYRLVFWTLIPIISGIGWGTITYVFLKPKDRINNLLQDLLLNELDVLYEDITYIGPHCYYTTSDGSSKVDSDCLVAYCYGSTVMVGSLLCIIFFATRTFLEYKDTLSITSKRSYKFNRLQRQTFYALVTQTIIPVVLMHFPCLVLMSAAMVDIDLGHSSAIVSITMATFPAIDPLPAMLIIKNYRDTLWSVMSTSISVFVRRQVKTKF